MDTRYWGPSGWRLLHLISVSPLSTGSRIFWEMLPYVLPCKFCRASLSDYYKEHPIPSEASEFPKWLYTIHNCVNAKLRSQAICIEDDPSFQEVKKHYITFFKQGCTKLTFPGWEFLFSIADNHPKATPSVQMPDTPEVHPKSLEERNRYNLLTTDERIQTLRKFWASIPHVLPFQEWKTSWNKHVGPIQQAITNRRSAKRWLWKIRCGLESDLQQLGTTNFHGLCKTLATHRSGCSKSKNAKTCRRTRGGSSKRKTLRNKQR
jgi:hypothetical protein